MNKTAPQSKGLRFCYGFSGPSRNGPQGQTCNKSTFAFIFGPSSECSRDEFEIASVSETRLRVVPLSLSPSLRDAKENRESKMAARNPFATPRPQDLARPFFSRGFPLRHARRTKRKRDYSQSRAKSAGQGRIIGKDVQNQARERSKMTLRRIILGLKSMVDSIKYYRKHLIIFL